MLTAILVDLSVQAHLWSRAAHMFESALRMCELQQVRPEQQAMLGAWINQCLILWEATEDTMTMKDRRSIMEKAIAGCNKLRCGKHVIPSCYWMLTCLVCRNEAGAQHAIDAMMKTDGIRSEHVFCLEALALKQGLSCIVFDLRCLALRIQQHRGSTESILDAVILGIKAIARVSTDGSKKAHHFAACLALCNELMHSLVRCTAVHVPNPSIPGKILHFRLDFCRLVSPGFRTMCPQPTLITPYRLWRNNNGLVQVHEVVPAEPIAVINKILTSVCLFVVRGSRQSDLAPNDTVKLCHSLLSVCTVYPEVGIGNVFRVFQVVAAAIDSIIRAGSCFVAQNLGPSVGDLFYEGVTAMQSCIYFMTKNEADSDDFGRLRVLVTFALCRVLEFKNWSIHDPDLVPRWSQIIDCMQDLLCTVLDCIQHCSVGVITALSPFATPICLTCILQAASTPSRLTCQVEVHCMCRFLGYTNGE